jgi:hypothetical protein
VLRHALLNIGEGGGTVPAPVDAIISFFLNGEKWGRDSKDALSGVALPEEGVVHAREKEELYGAAWLARESRGEGKREGREDEPSWDPSSLSERRSGRPW